jgi:predicted MFS family arabinose efflux permease
MPLWVLTLEASPLVIGVVLGSRHFLPMLLSIHGGAMMDRLGTRRVMLGFALIGMVVPLLFPMLPWIWAVMILQMMSGLADTMGWAGAQTMIGQVMKGNPTHAGRLAFFLRIGHFSGPPLIGAAWDILGPWGAFGTLSLWGACGLVAAWFLPRPAAGDAEAERRISARDLVPRLSDYLDTFRLLAIPAVLFVIMVTTLRHSGTAMQNSFYVVYLEGIGISGTAIGLLFTAAAVVGAVGALSVGRLSRIFDPVWLLLFAVTATVVIMTITPLLGVYVLLLAAMALRGGVLGISQPLMISILGRSLDADSQGKGVGLRTTANRVMNTIVPPAAGAIVQFAGLENSFYIIGAVAVGLLGLVVVYGRHHNAFRAA